MKKTACLLLTMFLAGCMSVTADQLRANPSRMQSFTVDGNSRDVFGKVLSHARTCYQKGASEDSLAVRQETGDIAGTASISVVRMHAASSETLFTIDLTGTRDGRTEVKVFYALERYQPVPRMVEEWITKDSAECLHNRIVVNCVCYLPWSERAPGMQEPAAASPGS